VKIGIDAHAIGSRLGGNETYVAGLLRGIGDSNAPHDFVAYFASAESADQWRDRYANIATRVLRASSSAPRLLAELPLRAWRDRLDLLHVQAVAPPMRLTPIVATVHDISYEFHPEFFSPHEVQLFRRAIRHTARHARQVVTISQASRSDLLRYYRLAPARVHVVYCGVDLSRFRHDLAADDVAACLRRYGIAQPYVLAVGNLQPRKNLARLIDAFALLRRDEPRLPHTLVLTGKAAYQHAHIVQRIQAHGLSESVVMTGYVPDTDLPLLYRGAAIFAYPSIYEGFGLPVLEALACGTPVLTSDRAPFTEVTGDVAVLVRPEDTAAIATGLRRLIHDTALARTLAERGPQRAQAFTWEGAARQTVAVFERAVAPPAAAPPRTVPG
jgi:glycosyltransferase involved in cell wall biosynthesis